MRPSGGVGAVGPGGPDAEDQEPEHKQDRPVACRPILDPGEHHLEEEKTMEIFRQRLTF